MARKWEQMKLCATLRQGQSTAIRMRRSTIKLKIKVLPATPKVEENPAVNIQYGQSLKDAVISGGKVINPNYILGQKQMIVDGNGALRIQILYFYPDTSCAVVFTPEDTKNYTGATEKEVSVTVSAAKPDLTMELDRETQVAGKRITVSAKAKMRFLLHLRMYRRSEFLIRSGMELSRLLQEMRSRSLLGPLSGRSSRSRRKQLLLMADILKLPRQKR